MADALPQTPRMPRQPKLRSSCNACGAVKLRCDRGQPQCGRCSSLGLLCVYGVSRKMGKPRREMIRIPEMPRASHTLGERADSHDTDNVDSLGSGTNGSNYDVRSIEGIHPTSTGTSVDALDVIPGDLFGTLLPDLTSLEFDNGFTSNLETGSFSTLGSPGLESYLTSMASTEASQSQIDEARNLDSIFPPAAGSKGHDCCREAHDILSSLSLRSLNHADDISESPPGSASTDVSSINGVPLDHVLRLNREACERLGGLLNCSCAGSPHLALLYASIISRVLSWYQQAADITQSASWSLSAIRPDTVPHHMSVTGLSPRSGFGSGGGPSTWPSAAASTYSTGHATGTPTSTQVTGLTVSPAKMAIGTFNVDDLGVQTALKIQLLSGEMRRAGRLIDQFSCHQSGGQFPAGERSFGDVPSLFQGLDSWLRREHSRIVNTMRSKLRELNT